MIGAVSGEFNTKKKHLFICAEYVPVYCYVIGIKEATTDCSGGSD